MRTLIEIEHTENGLVMSRHPAVSPFWPMQQHLRALSVYPVMRLPRISPNALLKAIELGGRVEMGGEAWVEITRSDEQL